MEFTLNFTLLLCTLLFLVPNLKPCNILQMCPVPVHCTCKIKPCSERVTILFWKDSFQYYKLLTQLICIYLHRLGHSSCPGVVNPWNHFQCNLKKIKK